MSSLRCLTARIGASIVVSLAALAFPVLAGASPLLLVTSVGNSTFFDDAVKRYDGTTGASTGTLTYGLFEPTGVAFGPDGHVYVTNDFGNSVNRYNSSTGALIDIFVQGGGLDSPTDLAFGPDGNLYVVSPTSHSVRRYDGTTGAFIDVFASAGLNTPISLAFGPDGDLYVANHTGHNVFRYDLTTGGLAGISFGGLDSPRGLAVGPDGHLYVAGNILATNSSGVYRYDGATGLGMGAFILGGFGPAFGTFLQTGLTFGPDGNLYITSYQTDDVRRFDGTTGAFIDIFASGGGLDGPVDLAFSHAVPEPGTLALVLVGLLGVAGARRRTLRGSATSSSSPRMDAPDTGRAPRDVRFQVA